ncbi:MAG: DcrB-related protein [Acidobacteriota bacterium]
MKMIANGFITDLPQGWEDRSMITLVGPTGSSGFAANVVVTREHITAPTNIEDYAKEQGEAMAAEIPGVEVLDERAITLHGAPAFQRLQRFVLEGQHIQQAQTFVLGEGGIFVITCSASVVDFDKNILAFRHIVETFRLFKPEAVAI